eukprot:Pgem_evm1s15310
MRYLLTSEYHTKFSRKHVHVNRKNRSSEENLVSSTPTSLMYLIVYLIMYIIKYIREVDQRTLDSDYDTNSINNTMIKTILKKIKDDKEVFRKTSESYTLTNINLNIVCIDDNSDDCDVGNTFNSHTDETRDELEVECGERRETEGTFIKDFTYSFIEVIARKCDLNCFRQ